MSSRGRKVLLTRRPSFILRMSFNKAASFSAPEGPSLLLDIWAIMRYACSGTIAPQCFGNVGQQVNRSQSKPLAAILC